LPVAETGTSNPMKTNSPFTVELGDSFDQVLDFLAGTASLKLRRSPYLMTLP
jgi:hypothetical protein